MVTHKRLIIAVLIYAAASLLLLPVLARCEESPFLRVFSETSQPRGGASLPADHPGASSTLPRGLSLEIDETKAVSSKQDNVYDITFWSGSSCPPCRVMKPLLISCPRLRVAVEVDKPLPAGVPAPNDPTPPTYPCVTFRTASGRLYYDLKSRTAEQVVNAIERAELKENQRRLTPAELKNIASTWSGSPVGVVGMTVRQHLMDSNHGFTADQLAGLTNGEMLAIHSAHHAGDITPFAESAVTASEAQGSVGSAGVIRGGRLIGVALDWWQKNIGEGVKVSGSWARNGGQTLPLRRLGRWESTEIYGTHGEFEIQADGSRLPVQSAVLGYKLINGRLRLNAETELDAAILNIGNTPQSVASAQPVGVSPMLILSVLSTVWQLLHPQADLQLPGHVACEAVMTGGVVTVTFSSMPSVRIVMLFTFQLGVQSVVISRESVVIKFSGSRWIRERTFEVRE